MKIALAQMDVLPNQPEKNLETMLAMINEAKAENVDLIAFPELCVSGYLLGDFFLEEDKVQDFMTFNEKLKQASHGIAIAYGNIHADHNINERLNEQNGKHPNKDGRIRKYNAVRIFQDGKEVERKKEHPFLPKGVQAKTLLPNYRFFDDERYFFSTEDVAKDFNVPLESLLQPYLIKTQDGQTVPIGFEVCEDLWCEDYRRNGEAQNITKMLIENGAKYIVNLSASPWTVGKNETRDKRIKFLKEDIGDKFVPFFYVNCVGAQNNGKNIITFDGASTVYNSKAQPVALAQAPYEEELMIIDTDNINGIARHRIEGDPIEQKYQAIIRSIQHLKDMTAQDEHPRFVIGMSGGVDSSLVASLLVDAVGKEKVIGVNMPTQYNSDETKASATHTAEALGIPLIHVPVGSLADHNELLLTSVPGPKFDAVQKGNIAAKIRGTSILSNLAARYGALMTNNGNKVEVHPGYATLYGDVNGAIAPIADLTKAEVFDMARYINTKAGEDIIQEKFLPDHLYRFQDQRGAPSAELEEEQFDPMKFGYHCALLTMMTDYKKKGPEHFMQMYLNGTLHTKLEQALDKEPGWGYEIMKRWGVDQPEEFVKDIEWWERAGEWAVFKRVQGPPIPITSKSSYGYDIRESILPRRFTQRHHELKKLITTPYKPMEGVL